MSHLPARQQLAVVVAAIDSFDEAIDAPADVVWSCTVASGTPE